MEPGKLARNVALVASALAFAGLPARAQSPYGDILIQCPGDANGDAVPDETCPADSVRGACVGLAVGAANPEFDEDVICHHASGGDGFSKMGDGTPIYQFGFGDVTDVKQAGVMDAGRLGATSPSPTIALEQGKRFYLSLTNVGMMVRPDLFDEHTIHFHAFPQAAAVFDGVPDSSISIGMGATITYFYNLVEEGTYIYHCHVEATEHMQMGMMGNLFVRSSQDRTGIGGTEETPDMSTVAKRWGGNGPDFGYVFNDGDGSTAYDVEVPLQLMSYDPNFHNASFLVQPLPFRDMRDTYPLLNGRGYPDTIVPGPVGVTAGDVGGWDVKPDTNPVTSLVEAAPGQRILFRISNMSVTQFMSLTTDIGVPFEIVGYDAKWLGGPDNYVRTNVIDLGGGQVVDAIIDTTGVPAGTYFLYTNNMYNLSNADEDFGGVMTEIHIGSGS